MYKSSAFVSPKSVNPANKKPCTNDKASTTCPPKDEKEILDHQELIAAFTLEGINRSNAAFNFDANNPKRWTDDKALWMNAEYIRGMSIDEIFP